VSRPAFAGRLFRTLSTSVPRVAADRNGSVAGIAKPTRVDLNENPPVMVSRSVRPALLLAAVLALASPLAAQAPPAPPAPADAKPEAKKWWEKVEISGLLFGDAYAVVAHHDPDVDGQWGFWLRRGYLTFDVDVAKAWSARFRLEVNSPGDFESSAKMTPFVKDAYVAWKGSGHELYLGISPSPTFELVEGAWGYRAVEKTPLDLYRLGSSRDFGVAWKGKAAGGKLSWHAMLGNGAGEGGETNEGKKAMLSIAYRPAKELVVEAYADTEDRPDSSDRRTFHAFAGYRGARSRYGVEYATQKRTSTGGPDQTVAVASVYGAWDAGEKLSLLARVDRSFDGIPDAGDIPYLGLAADTRFDLAIVGLEYRVHRAISVLPNLEYVAYRETGGRPAPDDDLIARLTLYVRF
jgi:hypothetical protein